MSSSAASLQPVLLPPEQDQQLNQLVPISPQSSTPSNSLEEQAMQIRSSFYTRLTSLQTSTKLFLFFNLLLTISKIIVTSIITTISAKKEESCVYPLREYIIVNTILGFLYFPCLLYIKVNPRQTDSNESNGESTTDAINRQDIKLTKKLRSFLDLYSMLWFILGNYWTFASINHSLSSTCNNTSPLLFYTSLTFIIIGYVRILLPLLLILLILFCFPFVLVFVRVMRRFGFDLIGEVSSVVKRGLLDSNLSKLQKYKYAKDSTPTSNGSNDNCVICLGEYESGEWVKKLPCNHVFHANCVDDWLKLQKSCPLCVCDVEEALRKKKTVTKKKEESS